MPRYSVSVVEGFRTVWGGSHAVTKRPVEVSILDSARAFLQVKVICSGQPVVGVLGGMNRERTIAYVERICAAMNADERAWEQEHQVQTWAHGQTGYNNHGCRCPICREGHRRYVKARRARLGCR